MLNNTLWKQNPKIRFGSKSN